MQRKELEQKLGSIEDQIFLLEMKDSWNYEDSAEYSRLQSRKADIERTLHESECK